MKIKLVKIGNVSFSKLRNLIKKNLELTFLICTALTVIILVQIFNLIKDQKKINFFDILNNLYFEKTLHVLVDNLDPKYINIESGHIFYNKKSIPLFNQKILGIKSLKDL